MLLVIGILVVLIIGLVVVEELGREARKKPVYSYARKEYFLTQRETECYKHLVSIVGSEYFVFAQVSLGSLLDERKPGQSWKGARAHINRKSVDFLLCDKNYISPKLAIELDDWTHNRQDRIDRDGEVERILRESGIPLLRVQKTEELNEKLKPALT